MVAGLSMLHIALAFATPLATQQIAAARSGFSKMSRTDSASQVNRALQRLRRGVGEESSSESPAVVSAPLKDATDGGDACEDDNKFNGVKLLVYEDHKGQEWISLGANKTAAVKWLCYQLGASAVIADVESGIREEVLVLGDRKVHRRIRRLWRASRLLLRGYRLSDLSLYGRMHAEQLASAEPARSRRLVERAFRSELVANVQRARRLYNPSIAERRHILYYVRAASGLDLAPLRRPKEERRKASSSASSSFSIHASSPAATTHSYSAATPLQSLDEWRELLSWFRDHFPYNRAACESCGLHGDFIGNVFPGREERKSEATRAELQYCGVCDSIQRFPRYNDVGRILETRQGRCGEYTQVLLQLVRALGWPARMVVDWQDHMWVEVLLPVGPAAKDGEEAAAGGGQPTRRQKAKHGRRRGWRLRGKRRGEVGPEYRWVHLDPCEAAVDEPTIYGSWGKTHDYVIAMGDGHVADVTASYAKDWNATLQARDLSPTELRRALRRCSLRRGKTQVTAH